MAAAGALSYQQIQDAVLGSRFPGRMVGDAQRWIKDAYEAVWASADWSFAYVSLAPITVTSATPTMPAGYSGKPRLYDDNGYPLALLDQRTFEDTYTGATGTGRPEAYTVVNQQIILGPTPNGSYTYKLSYLRGLAHKTSAGATVTGFFTDPSDYPLWDDHHQILVSMAIKLGLVEINDPTWYPFDALIARMLADMIADLAVELPGGTIWGGP